MTGPDMPQDDRDRPDLFQAQADAWDKNEQLFGQLRVDYDDEKSLVSGLRRRRRRASNAPDDPVKTVSLLERDGVLLWCDDIPEGEPAELPIGPRRRRLRRRAGLPP